MKERFSWLKNFKFENSKFQRGFIRQQTDSPLRQQGFTFPSLARKSSPAFQRGFTLVELLIVIAVIGILVTLVIVAVDPIQVIRKSQDTRRRSDLQAVRVALQQFYNDYKYYPRNNDQGQILCWSASGTDGAAIPFNGTSAWNSNGSSSCTTSDTSYIKALPKNPTFTTGGYYYQVYGSWPFQNYRLMADLSYSSTDDDNAYTKCGAINTDSGVITINNPSVPTVDFAVCND